MQISYHGHSIVKIKTGDYTILIDPFITGNKLTDLTVEDEKPDVILLTHGHNDHVGDTVAIAKASDALVVAPNELAVYLGWQGVKTHGMNIGGACKFDFGTVKFTQAFHSSSYTTEDNEIIYTGMPAGILFTAEGENHLSCRGYIDIRGYGDDWEDVIQSMWRSYRLVIISQWVLKMPHMQLNC